MLHQAAPLFTTMWEALLCPYLCQHGRTWAVDLSHMRQDMIGSFSIGPWKVLTTMSLRRQASQVSHACM